jgi:hypothetical protein
MTNVQKPASATAKEKKLLLFPGDPLINVLKPDYYVVVDPGSLEVITAPFLDASEYDPTGDDPVEDEPEDRQPAGGLAAPSLSDITLVSKTMVTDKNKNQFVEFVFNIKNSGGDTVIGVEGYGQ